MQTCHWPISELITHSGDKILLHSIVGFDAESLIAEASVRADSVYLKDGAEPPWIGLEYMAQAIAALAGIRQRQRNQPPKVGMLIGTRRYRCNVKHFPVGMNMTIKIKALLEDDQGLSVFECHIHDVDLIAQANLNVYQPPSIESYLSDK